MDMNEMNEKLEGLLEDVKSTAIQVTLAASETAADVGQKANELLLTAKANIRVAELNRRIAEALKEVGEMVYATHTGNPTESEILLAKLQEIDGYHEEIEAVRATVTKETDARVCPICGSLTRAGDLFCRECGGRLE